MFVRLFGVDQTGPTVGRRRWVAGLRLGLGRQSAWVGRSILEPRHERTTVWLLTKSPLGAVAA